MKLAKWLTGIMVMLLIGAFIYVANDPEWINLQRDDAALITVARPVSVNYLLNPGDIKITKPSSEFDITENRRIVLRSANKLLCINPGRTAETRQLGMLKLPGDSFAWNDGTPLAISAQFLGALDKTGVFEEALPLPFPGMKIAGGSTAGKVYLYGGRGICARRVYAIEDNGQLSIPVQLPKPVTCVCDSEKAIFVSDGQRIFRITQKSMQLAFRMPPGDTIRSIAVEPQESVIYFSTDKKVYALRGNTCLTIVRDMGGELRYRSRELFLWSKEKNQLVSFPNVGERLIAWKEE